MRHTTSRLCSTLLLLVVAFSVSSTAQKKEKDPGNAAHEKEAIWRDPGNVAALDMLYGAGGKAHAPDPNGAYRFVKEDAQATSPKFDVEDQQGVRWKVKLGEEPESETAATRFLWAAGYFVDEDYFLEELKVTGMPALHRGGHFVSADGTVHRARLERGLSEMTKEGSWDWFDNPFVDSRELNGLRVMMSLVNNWDLSQANNSIDDMDGERRYVVADVGATFGNTGNSLTRSKSVPGDYARSSFIEKATGGLVDFVLHSRPFFLSAVVVNNYRDRTRMEQVTKQIPRADAKWLGAMLSRLSGDQIRDAFRGAGYSHDEVEAYATTVQSRIAELVAL